MWTKAVENVEASVDMTKRTVEAIVSRFGNRDHVGDRVRKGAFARTLASGRFSRGLVSTKYNHEVLIGKPLHAEETEEGLFMAMKFSPTKQGDEILALVQDGALTTYSFKYTIDPNGAEYVKEPDGRRTRELKSLELWEAGPVDPDLAVNDATRTLGVKSLWALDGPEGIKGLYDLGEAVSALARLEGAESWAKEMYGYLSDEDKAALQALVSSLSSASNTVQAILSAGEGKAATNDFHKQLSALVEARVDRIRAGLR